MIPNALKTSYLTLGIFCLSLGNMQSIFAQSTTSKVFGTIKMDQEPAIGANIQIPDLNRFGITDEKGFFLIEDIPYGSYELEISYVGAVARTEALNVSEEEISIDVELQSDMNTLDAVTVTAQSKTLEIQSLPISVSSLDARALNNQAIGAEELLKRSTGIVVRQQGGLGSQTSINLNGLTGPAVRIYYDGIPLQVFGGGVQINNIPVDALERMDVYKGVMPVDVGTDALGGGINLVPFKSFREYFRASYTISSFNTHRVTLGGRKNFGKNFSLSALSFVNSSDNDYEMRNIPNLQEKVLENGTVTFEEELINARRFHNCHFSAFFELEAALQNVSWADRLSLAASYSNRFDEIQHGRVIQNLAVGEATNQIDAFTARIDYRKKLFNDKLSLRYFGLVSYTLNAARDSSTAVYNWTGERLQSISRSSGSELFAIPTLRDGENLGTAHRVVVNYKLHDYLNLTVSDFYRYSSIEGEDPVGARLNIGGQRIDPNTIPSRLTRNIFGAEIKSELFSQKLTAIAFYKNYNYSAESIDILQSGATILPIRTLNANQHGFGFALKYSLTASFFVRGSFEQATRIPNETEIFGDFGAIVPNYTLRPEQSDNFNVGFHFNKNLSGGTRLNFQVDGFVRNRKDLIRLDAFGPENAIFINEAEVDGMGIEFATTIIPIRRLKLTGNFTYQSNEITSPQLSVGALRGAQVPNIPRLFFNVGASYTFQKVFHPDASLELFWNYFFIDRFSINEVKDLDTANPTFVIPTQNLHNVGFVYAPNLKGLQFSFSIQNLFDELLYDNFRIPRPGINYSFKINYSL